MADRIKQGGRDQAGLSRSDPVPAIYPPAEPLEAAMDRFWNAGPQLEEVHVDPRPPDQPLEVLERLGSSPFERGRFPVVGFLATTYERVSRYALGQR